MRGPAYVAHVPADEFSKEAFQPRCIHHEAVWHGPLTFQIDGAQTNVRVHNEDEHPPADSTFALDVESHSFIPTNQGVKS